jgi:hypothetical protein
MTDVPKELPKKARRIRGPDGPRIDGGGREARRLAAAILDVLGGARTPTDAAGAVGISLPKYYALEARALEGLVRACEPRTPGRRRAPEREAGALRKEVERLTRECFRKQALLRAVQRSVALPEPKALAPAKGKKRRRPTVRALKAVDVLRSSPESAPETGPEATAESGGPGP